MRRLLLMSVAVLAVSGCARVIDGATQRVSIETPGAEGAACFLENEEFRYKLYAPQTITMTKTRKPLHVRCLAPGNRQKEIIVTPEIEQSTYANATNLFTGAFIDYETASMYRLPDTIVVDFTDMAPMGMPPPKYDRFFAQHPELRGMEEFRPGQAALQSDMYDMPVPLRRRETPGEGDSVIGGGAGAVVDEPASTGYTGSNGGSADELTRSMNPRVFGGGGAAPVTGSNSGGTDDDASGYPLPLMR